MTLSDYKALLDAFDWDYVECDNYEFEQRFNYQGYLYGKALSLGSEAIDLYLTFTSASSPR
jgi:hypothetical protein